MLKGCLTGIKPGRGTNRNEALHKKLNKIVTSSRYGIELAYALFSTIFFMHNERIAAKKEDRRERVIMEYGDLEHHPNSREYFGIQWLNNDPSIAPVTDMPLTLQRSTYSDFECRITGKEVVNYKKKDLEPDTQQDTGTSDDEDFFISLDAQKLILLKALSWYFVHEHMAEQSKRSKVPLKELPFMNSALSKLLNCDGLEAPDNIALSESTNRDVMDIHAKRLDGVLKSWNFKRIPVTGDGNCLFYAVAHAILQKKKNYASLAESVFFISNH